MFRERSHSRVRLLANVMAQGDNGFWSVVFAKLGLQTHSPPQFALPKPLNYEVAQVKLGDSVELPKYPMARKGGFVDSSLEVR